MKKKEKRVVHGCKCRRCNESSFVTASKSAVFALLLVAVALVVYTTAVAQGGPVVFHSPSEIGPGTFMGGGEYIFPSNLIVGADTLVVDTATSEVRIGNLDVGGALDVTGRLKLVPRSVPSSPEEGELYYDSSKKKVLMWDASGEWTEFGAIPPPVAPVPPAVPSCSVCGAGTDPATTISSDTTLARDMHYQSLTVNSGKTLKTNGFRIFVSGKLTNNGVISAAGASGSNGGAHSKEGNNYVAGAGGAGGVGFTANNLGGSASGGGGGGGCALPIGFSGRRICNGGDGTAGSGISPRLGGAGGAGGTDRGAGVGAAGAGTSVTAEQTTSLINDMARFLTATLEGGTKINGGAGGGGGAGGRLDTTGTGSYTSAPGGGGGAGGGVMVIIARELENNGLITVQGGDGGGDGTYKAPVGSSPDIGGGNGGGGGGGAMLIVTSRLADGGTFNVDGGSGGQFSAGATGGAGYKVAIIDGSSNTNIPLSS